MSQQQFNQVIAALAGGLVPDLDAIPDEQLVNLVWRIQQWLEELISEDRRPHAIHLEHVLVRYIGVLGTDCEERAASLLRDTIVQWVELERDRGVRGAASLARPISALISLAEEASVRLCLWRTLSSDPQLQHQVARAIIAEAYRSCGRLGDAEVAVLGETKGLSLPFQEDGLDLQVVNALVRFVEDRPVSKAGERQVDKFRSLVQQRFHSGGPPQKRGWFRRFEKVVKAANTTFGIDSLVMMVYEEGSGESPADE